MTKRTDPHRPSAINLEDYVFLAWYDHGYHVCPSEDALEINREHRMAVANHLANGGKGFVKVSRGHCQCCGAFHNTGATFIYVPDNSLIQFGWECAEHIAGMDHGAFKRFVKTAEDARQRIAGMAKAKVLMADHNLEPAFEWWNAIRKDEINPIGEAADFYNEKMITLRDMVDKLVRYGSMSDKAWDFMAKCWVWTQEADAKRAERKAKREQEDRDMIDVEAGRRQIQGEVLSVKWYESNWGDTKKILIGCGGFKVFTTCPSAIGGASKGDIVSMNITLEPKERGFAIGTRPAKAMIIDA